MIFHSNNTCYTGVADHKRYRGLEADGLQFITANFKVLVYGPVK